MCLGGDLWTNRILVQDIYWLKQEGFLTTYMEGMLKTDICFKFNTKDSKVR